MFGNTKKSAYWTKNSQMVRNLCQKYKNVRTLHNVAIETKNDTVDKMSKRSNNCHNRQKFGKPLHIFLTETFKDCVLSLSFFASQPYWKEEIPTIRIDPMVRERLGWLHSGHWSRGTERIDYIARMDTYLLYLRYSGDGRFCSTWQTAILNKRVTQMEGEIWSVSCPFCTTNVRTVLIGPRSLRCSTCFRVPSRWAKQNTLTYPYRMAIRQGALSEVKAALRGTPRERVLAMMAMELTGISPKKMSSPKGVAPWHQKKNRSIKR